MARSDAEIRQILRTIVPEPDQKPDFVDKGINWFTAVMGIFVIVGGIAVIASAGLHDPKALLGAGITVVLGIYLARPIFKALRGHPVEHKAATFRAEFAEGSEDFERAVQLLNMSKEVNASAKRLLDALGMDIQFDGAPPHDSPDLPSNDKYAKVFTPSPPSPSGEVLLGEFGAPPETGSVTDPPATPEERQERSAARAYIPLDPQTRPADDPDREA